jgi:biopolymer transport protein ExbD/biopolymer transport protein TolR
MAASSLGMAGPAGKRRRRRSPVMSEINVTPFVDVILVLLIIFMVAAPLLTVSIPIDLPEAKGGTPAKTTTVQLIVSAHKTSGTCNSAFEVYLGETLIPISELEAKIKAVKESGSQELSRNIKLRGDKDVCYADIMRILGRIKNAGFGADIEIIPEREG